MPDIARTIVSIEKGTISQIDLNGNKATVLTSNNRQWGMTGQTRIVANAAEMPLGEEIGPPAPGDAFVHLAALRQGDPVVFGASPYNTVLVVYTGQAASKAAARSPQLTT